MFAIVIQSDLRGSWGLQRLEELAQKGRKIHKTLRERQSQNEEIQAQIYEIGAHVAEQLRIKQGQAGGGKPQGITAEKKMRSLVTHRKLNDISVAQSQVRGLVTVAVTVTVAVAVTGVEASCVDALEHCTELY